MDYQRIMDTNVRAVTYLTHYAVPYLEASKGTIINVSSVAAMKSVIFKMID